MKLSTLKLLAPIVAVTIQSNSASTVIPPYLQHINISVALIGVLISLGPIFALMARLPVGMLYHRENARSLVSVAILVMGVTNFLYCFATDGMGDWVALGYYERVLGIALFKVGEGDTDAVCIDEFLIVAL